MSHFEIRNKDVPCYECGDRHESCHSTCARYLAYREKVDKENELKRIKSDIDIRSYICRSKTRNFR